ncbi:MAG: ketoacyl-ACP synthase III [Clostridiales bacterium]|jgi:3-oxoacyl-[acyl-carrier-protein] synthase-3|nr:ketoacyl-ACP synthase III [Clostridiales bacterium]
MSLKIIGTGKALPERTVTNDELAGMVDTNDEWIISKTGIKERRVCTWETAASLAEQAGRRAVERAGLALSEIDMLICATVSGDYVTPSLACCVLERLGVSCPAFDISAACPGFVYALDAADAYITSGKAKNILIVAAERMSRNLDWNDRATCILMGDGAGACVVTAGNALKYSRLWAAGEAGMLYVDSGTGNSPFADAPSPRGYIHMQGQQVFKFAVRAVESEIRLALEKLNMNAEAVDYFVLHQANKRIIDSARLKLKQPEAKFPVNIDRYGNLSAASIPVLLDEMLAEGKIAPGTALVLMAFGGGPTAGISVLVWE